MKQKRDRRISGETRDGRPGITWEETEFEKLQVYMILKYFKTQEEEKGKKIRQKK